MTHERKAELLEHCMKFATCKTTTAKERAKILLFIGFKSSELVLDFGFSAKDVYEAEREGI